MKLIRLLTLILELISKAVRASEKKKAEVAHEEIDNDPRAEFKRKFMRNNESESGEVSKDSDSKA